jgi:aspartate/glutamate racemase
LCDEVIGQQQQLLNNKDSLITLEKQQNESWRRIINEGLQQQEILVNVNRLYRKQAKKLKTKKTILSGAVIALSALLIKSIIK